MNLSELITTLPIQPQPDQCWAVLGPEASAFAAKLRLAGVRPANLQPGSTDILPELDGLLLAGALSAEVNAVTWLQQTVEPLKKGALLVVVEWQSDGPLDVGPELERRFKRGKLCRLLRGLGFGMVRIVQSQPLYYLVGAVKAPPAPQPHAGEFVTVATLDELPKNGMKQVELFGQPIIVANTGREIVAFAATCPHASTPLYKGKLRGRQIICALHFYMWNVCTGEPVDPDDEDILPTYPVKVDIERGWVQVALGG
jgi:toluene monooxygenase system ferredoxin subunit